MGPSLVCVAFSTSSLSESVIGLKWLFRDSRGSAAGRGFAVGEFQAPDAGRWLIWLLTLWLSDLQTP